MAAIQLGDIVLGPRAVVQPDLFVVPKPLSADVHWRDVARPLLAIEVLSPSTAGRDRRITASPLSAGRVPEDLTAFFAEVLDQ